MNLEEITEQIKKIESEKVDFSDIAAITQFGNTTDPWLAVFAMLVMLPGMMSTSSADYWRGKYDGYKEGIQATTKTEITVSEEQESV